MLAAMQATTAERASAGRDHRDVTRLNRLLGHPGAFLVTTALLLAVFGATFVLHPERSAPTRDPAYYTWRTQVLTTEEPVRILQIEGPFGLYSGGYRISVPVLAGTMARAAGMEIRSGVALVMVIVPVLTSLLLAGFAYRYRPDPLMWHSVALAAGGMMLTPPFVGYLDNLLGVFFLAGALWFLGPSRQSWWGRVGLALFLIVAGATHPTTLAVFILMTFGMTFVRFVFGRIEGGIGRRLVSAVRDDGPMLLTATATLLLTYLVWTIGLWGEPAPLSESALVFPYEPDFFYARFTQWVAAMRPLLNGPLVLIGLAGLLAAGRRFVDDELARVSLVWMGPLIGIFGFLLGLAYPYFRFFNTTLAWVLLIGVGAYFAIRFFLDVARGGGVARLALVGVGAIAFILATNFSHGLVSSAWSDPTRGWLTPQKRLNLDLLRVNLETLDDLDRPVVFISDARPPEIASLAQVWGITQLNGNTGRYGLPEGQIDQGYVYQGELERFLAAEPTLTGDDAYDDLSRESLREIVDNAAHQDPLIVVAAVFNENGPNAALAGGQAAVPPNAGDADIWILHEGEIESISGDTQPPVDAVHQHAVMRTGWSPSVFWALLVVALLFMAGALAVPRLVGYADAAAYLAMAPTLGIVLCVVVGTLVLAVAADPLSKSLSWTVVALCVVTGAVLRAVARRGATSLS